MKRVHFRFFKRQAHYSSVLTWPLFLLRTAFAIAILLAE